MDSITTDFWDVILWSFWFFIWIAALMVWFRCLFDLFGDRSLSGWGKAGWAVLADLRAVAGCADLPHRPGPEHERAADGGVGRTGRPSRRSTSSRWRAPRRVRPTRSRSAKASPRLRNHQRRPSSRR